MRQDARLAQSTSAEQLVLRDWDSAPGRDHPIGVAAHRHTQVSRLGVDFIGAVRAELHMRSAGQQACRRY